MIYWLAEQQWLVDAALDLDRLIKSESIEPSALIYVAGVPRSRTTFFAEKINENPHTASFTYSNFPLLNAPNLWPLVSRLYYGSGKYVERPHRDGILVGAGSVDSFDEILWQTDGLASSDRRHNGEVNRAVVERYLQIIRRFLGASGSSVYFAKNNAMPFRAEQVLGLIPQAKLLIILRHPSEVIPSLVRNHHLFCQYVEDNPKYRRRMYLLCHSEFGVDVRYPIDDEDTKTQLSDFKASENWETYYSLIFIAYIQKFHELANLNQPEKVFFLNSDKPSLELHKEFSSSLSLDLDISNFSQSTYSYEVPKTPEFDKAVVAYNDLLKKLAI